MIYVTGDIHAQPERFSLEKFPEQSKMSREDFVIVCGDFGLCFKKEESDEEKYWLDWLEDKPYTTCFVDGNHENFTRLNRFPVEMWHGGKVHKLRPHVIHLMRGEMFELCEKHIFAFGGARSHDIDGSATKEELEKDYTAGVLRRNDPDFEKKKEQLHGRWTRIEEESWWRAEMPSEEEMQHGLATLNRYHMQTDFIISHDAPASVLAVLSHGWTAPNPLNQYLEKIRQMTEYKAWFFGHHHVDRQVTEKDSVLYYEIQRIV